MVVLRKGMLLVLALALTACSSGLLGKKSDSEDDDDETDPADEPVEVAGSFLTASCGFSTVKPAAMPADDASLVAYGCAMIDSKTNTKFQGTVAFEKITFGYADGTSEAPALEPTADLKSPWHVLTFIARGKAAGIKRFEFKAIVDGVAVESANGETTRYEPEGPPPEVPSGSDTGTETKTPTDTSSDTDTDTDTDTDPGTGVETLLSLKFANASEVTNFPNWAWDGDSTTKWIRMTVTSAHLTVDLNEEHVVQRILFSACEDGMSLTLTMGNGAPTGGIITNIIGTATYPFPMTRDVVTTLDLSGKPVADRKFRYIAFELPPTQTCLNGVEVYGF